MRPLSSANHTRGPTDGDVFYFSSVGGAGVQRFIDDTDADDGDHMLVVNADTGQSVGVVPPVGTTIAIKASSSTNPGWVWMMRISGNWVPTAKVRA